MRALFPVFIKKVDQSQNSCVNLYKEPPFVANSSSPTLVRQNKECKIKVSPNVYKRKENIVKEILICYEVVFKSFS